MGEGTTMSLKLQLVEDMKSAMRAREMMKLNVIRFLQAEIKNVEIDNGEQDDAGIQKIIARQIKQMKDAITDYKTGGRQDLIDEETQKITVLEAYLPQQMSDGDLEKIVGEVVAELGQGNFGQVMGAVMKRVAGLADGNRVSAAVKAALAA